VYENEYSKEDGIWKIWALRYFPFLHTEYGKEWSFNEEDEFVGLMSEARGLGNELGPNGLMEGQCMLWIWGLGNGNDGSCDIVVYTIDRNGKKTEKTWYKNHFAVLSMTGISEN
jgi:hypothetical protein